MAAPIVIPHRPNRGLHSPAGVRRRLAALIRKVERGEAPPEILKAVAYGCQVLLRAIELEVELTVEARIASMEERLAKLKEAPAPGDTRARLLPPPTPEEEEQTARLRAKVEALAHGRDLKPVEPTIPAAPESAADDRKRAQVLDADGEAALKRVQAELEAEASTSSTPDIPWMRERDRMS